MTIDEAIAIAKEQAKYKNSKYDKCPKRMLYCCEMCFYNPKCNEVAEQCEQLAEWLEELKDHRERECNHINEALYDKGYSDGYNKAIEYFVMLFKSKTSMENSLVVEIAEQLKAGETE